MKPPFLIPKIKVSKGFTLLEVIVAIFLLTTGIFGISALISQLVGTSTLSSQKLVAAYLAQEGIEIVRNIRDTNLLENENWDNGLEAGAWQADYNDQNLSNFTNTPLKLEDGGFYNYETGQETIFKRKITITPTGSDILKVLVEVSWQEKGRPHQLIAQENLYNWR